MGYGGLKNIETTSKRVRNILMKFIKDMSKFVFIKLG